MSERLSATALRARLSGTPAPEAPSPRPTADQPADLVSATFERYRTGAQAVPAPMIPAPSAKPSFRRGAEASEAATPVETPRAAAPVKPNAYGGSCTQCGGYVQAQAGRLVRTAAGWGADHLVCPPAAASADPVVAAVAAAEVEVPAGFVKITAITGQTYVGLQPGIYTLETSGGHRTFRVRVQGTEEDFRPGSTILEHLTVPDNEKDYTSFAFLNGTRMNVWSKHKDNESLLAAAREFLADPSKALLAARCIRCNKTLSTPESVKSLMGPDCRKKGW